MGVLPAFNTRSHINPIEGNSTSYLNNIGIAVPLGIGLCSLSLLTFMGNAMVVHAIRTERKLHTVSNMFILSLAIADLTVGLIVMPISSVYVLLGDWTLGLVICQLWLVIDYTASTASIFNLLILSLDRYWSIRSPLKYLCKRTKKRALGMIGIVWLISVLWVIPIIGWHRWHNNGVRKHPNNVCETEFNDSVVFKVTTSAANFFIPMILMVVIYYKIFCEIKRRGKIDIGRNLSVSCADHRSSLSKSSIRKQRKLLDRTNYVRSGACSSCSSFSAKQMTRISLNANEKKTEREKSSTDNSSRDKGSTGDDDLNNQNRLQLSNASVNSVASIASIASIAANNDKTVGINSSVKHYQQLTLMSVKPEKPVFTAVEDYRGVKVEVEYINGGSALNIINSNTSLESDSCGVVVNKTNEQKSNNLSNVKVMETNCDTFINEIVHNVQNGPNGQNEQNSHNGQQNRHKTKSKFKQKMLKTILKTNKNKTNGSEPELDSEEQTNDSNNSIKLKIRKKASKKYIENSLEVTFKEKRSSRPSIALPANEFCSECQCTAAAAVAATHHINALRREESSRLRQEKKAARQLGVILGAFILCWMPYIITFIVTAYCTDCVSNTVHQVAIWLGYVNSFLNPFLYALCNENFKQAFKKMLGRVKPHQPSYNFDLTHPTSFRQKNNNFS